MGSWQSLNWGRGESGWDFSCVTGVRIRNGDMLDLLRQKRNMESLAS